MKAVVCAMLIVGAVAGVLHADDHGDSPLTATPIQVDGSLLSACIEVPEDLDYFLFAGVSGRAYRLRTTHQSGEMVSVLYLFASDGRTILAVAQQSDDQAGARIDWTCPADGTYFAMVRHAQSVSGTGCYALSVSVELLDDHGDDRLSATPLAVNGEPTVGFIETPQDVDAFLFAVERGYDYAITLARTSSEGILSLQLVGDPEASVETLADREARLEIVGRESESLFLLVSSSASEGLVGFEIGVERTGYTDDHGNDAASASPLDPYGPAVRGAIEVSGDTDWFRLDARADGAYTFSLSPDAGVTCRLALRAADGRVVLEEATAVSGAPAVLEWTAPEEAVYYLEISSAGEAGRYSLAVTSTLQLESIGRFNPSGYSLDVWVRDGLAYLIVGVKGLSIVDVSEPTTPHEIGSHSTRGYAEAVALSGSLALVANRGEGLSIIDVSDPTRPTEVGIVETPGWAQDVDIEGELAVIADQRAGIHVVRFGATGSATLLSSYETRGHADAVDVDGQIVYVAIGDAGVETVDISDPASPTYLGAVELPGDARDVVVSDSVAYVAAGYRGVRILDVSDPTSPTEVGWLGTGDEAVGLHLAIPHLFVAERFGVSVYSLADPLRPERVAQIDTPGEAVAVFVSDGFVYIADRQEGLQIARLLP